MLAARATQQYTCRRGDKILRRTVDAPQPFVHATSTSITGRDSHHYHSTNDRHCFKSLARRFHSTAPVSSSNSSSSSNSNNSSNNTDKEDHQQQQQEKQQQRQWRQRADTMRDTAVQRSHAMRHRAGEHYREFREHPAEKSKQSAQTFGGMVKRYGPVFVGTYLTVYGTTLAALFGGIETGVLDPAVLFGWLGHAPEGAEGAASTVQLVVDWMQNHSFTAPYASYVEKNPSVANLAVAWIAVKFTEPIRFAVTLGITPRVARYLGYTPVVMEDGDNNDVDVDVDTQEERSADVVSSKGDNEDDSIGATPSTTSDSKTTPAEGKSL